MVNAAVGTVWESRVKVCMLPDVQILMPDVSWKNEEEKAGTDGLPSESFRLRVASEEPLVNL